MADANVDKGDKIDEQEEKQDKIDDKKEEKIEEEEVITNHGNSNEEKNDPNVEVNEEKEEEKGKGGGAAEGEGEQRGEQQKPVSNLNTSSIKHNTFMMGSRREMRLLNSSNRVTFECGTTNVAKRCWNCLW